MRGVIAPGFSDNDMDDGSKVNTNQGYGQPDIYLRLPVVN